MSKESSKNLAPVVGIVSWNRAALLRRCIEALERNTDSEIVICVVDQGSNDGTRKYLESLGDRVDHVASDENLGFVYGNNLIMDRYPDRDVILLNNDTEVGPGWLSALRDRAYSDDQIGVVGPKLVYPDGRLQAAGGEIFCDATGREIGKYDDPDRYIYNQVSDVDYCSGACMYIKRATLDAVGGGFDTRFAPAYWEDTDLCFAARDAGFRVVYEPRSEVVHFEGSSYGQASGASASAKLQEKNKPKFVDKWKSALEKQRSNVFEIAPVDGKEKILVILPFLPIFDKAAGEFRWFQTLQLLNEKYHVILLARNGHDGIRYINPLEEKGMTVFHTDTARLAQLGCEMAGPLWIDMPQLLSSNDFRAVIVGFWHVAAQYYHDIREHAPDASLIIDSYDVSFLRSRRKAELSGDPAELWDACETKRIELDWYRKADGVLTVTEQDRSVLLAEEPSLRVGISNDIHPVPEYIWNSDRKDLVFIGNFNHDPNEDGALWFATEVFPRVREAIPGIRFRIVGNAPTAKIRALAGKEIEVTGYVPEILPYLRESRVCVVPLRYGAGLKGKVGQALAAGIPQVTTSIGAEGMDLAHDRDVLIADDPAEFAREVIRLYGDEELQKKLAGNARDRAARAYSVDRARHYWEEVYSWIDSGRPKEGNAAVEVKESKHFHHIDQPPIVAPRVSIVMPVWNNLGLTHNCWASLRKNTKIPYELIIIDNGSTEPVSDDAAQCNYRCIRNDTNLGFAAAVNQGIRASHGEYVVLLNNDTIVTPGWLERLLAHFEESTELGMVAPLTNYANNEQRVDVRYADEEGLYAFSEKLHDRHRGNRAILGKLIGMCMVIPRHVIEEVGLFDERFGIGNFEDDDYCLRVRLAGYEIACAHDVFIHHEGGQTFRSLGIDYAALIEKNSQIFLQKWSFLQGGATSESGSDTCVFISHDEPGDEANLEEIIKGLPAAAEVVVVGGGPSGEVAIGGRTVQVMQTTGDERNSAVDQLLRRAEREFSVVISSSVAVGENWFAELLAFARNDAARALIAAIPEKGIPAPRENGSEPEFETTVDVGSPCVLVRSDAYRNTAGLPAEFNTEVAWRVVALDLIGSGTMVGAVKGLRVADRRSSAATDLTRMENMAVDKLVAARSALAAGDMELAGRAAGEALGAMPECAGALHVRAMAKSAAGDDEGAMQDWKTLRNLDPAFPGVLSNLGCIAFEQGRDTEAEHCFREALLANPDDVHAGRNLGDLYFTQGRIEEALTIYQNMVKKAPSDTSLLSDLGEWYERLGEKEGAADLYRQALRLDPEWAPAKDRLEAVGAGSASSNE